MTPAEFERVAARLGELEDWLQDTRQLALVHRSAPAVIGALDDCMRLAIAAHGQLQLELQHPDLAAEAPEPFDWPSCPLCGRPINVCHRDGCIAIRKG